MSGTAVKSRLLKMEAQLLAARCTRNAAWLEGLPETEIVDAILNLECDGDLQEVRRQTPSLRDLTDEEIREGIRRLTPDYIRHLRHEASELRAGRLEGRRR